MHSAEKARDSTLDDENTIHGSEGALDMTSVVVTTLCNQPEAFASNLGDDPSRYLYERVRKRL